MIDDNDPLRQCRHALALAERGLPVFPIREGAKFPPVFENFSERATTDPALIKRWWPEGSRLNIGIATGNGLLAMDYDCKGDQRGLLLKEIYESDHDLPETLEFQTGSDGIHALYETPAILEVPNRKSIEGPGSGVDVRAFHGYIVAPGSIVDGKKYTILHDRPIADMPAEFLDQRIMKHRLRGTPGGATLAPIGELDTPAAIDKARRWLIEDAPTATEGAGGDTTTYSVACRVKDFGISEGECLGLMLDFWNAEKAFPAWDPEDLERKVSNAYQYGQEPPGSKNYAGAFEPVDLEEDGDADTSANLLPFTPVAAPFVTRTADYVVHEILDRGMISLLTGPSGVGKSPISLDIASAVATGAEWCGRKTRQSYCLYVAAEGFSGLDRRREAVHQTYFAGAAKDDIPLDFVRASLDLRQSTKARKRLEETVLARAAHYGVKPGLVILDTLSKMLGGGDDSNAEHARAFLSNLERICARTGAAVMLLHHPTKSGDSLWRGSSIWVNDVDLLMFAEEGKGGCTTLSTPRAKEYSEIDPLTFRLEFPAIGVDDEGNELKAPIARWVPSGVSAADAFEPELSERAAKMMDEMQLQTGETIKTGAMVALLRLHHSSDSENTLRSEVRRIGAELVQIGYFEKSERGQWVRTEKPWVGAHGASDGAG